MTWRIWGAREISKCAPLWHQIAEQMVVRHPTLEADFLFSACKVLCDDPSRVHFGCQTRNDGVVDTAVLLERLQFGIWRVLSTAHLPVAPLVWSAKDAAMAHTGIESLIRSLPGAALFLRASNWDPDYSPSLHPDVCLDSSPTHTAVRVDIAGTFDDYWSNRSKNLRRSIRGLLNKAEAEGLSPKLIVLRTPTEIDSAIEAHGRLEETGWKRRSGKPLSKGDTETDFYLELLRNVAPQNRAWIFQLYMGDRLAASQFGVVAGPTLALLKTGYDDSLSRFAPGRVLDYFMLQHLFEQRDASRVEYCTIASEDDIRWSTAQRQICEVEIYRHPIVKSAINIARKMKRAIRNRRQRA
jgi:CelD/BcsL family acetyltransferase involved in cellulose biosynthesis